MPDSSDHWRYTLKAGIHINIRININTKIHIHT